MTDRSPCLEPAPHGCPFQYQDKRQAPCADCAARLPFQPRLELMRRKVQKRVGPGGQVRINETADLQDIFNRSADGWTRADLAKEYNISPVTVRKIALRTGRYADMTY